MMPELLVDRDDRLPLSAWAARLWHGRRVVELRCGQGVEVRSDRWVEGTWPDRFDEMRFHRGGLAGTGGRTVDEGLLLIPPFHPFDSLYTARLPESLHASNSLSFLLAETGLRLRLDHPHYPRDLMRVVRGLGAPEVVVPTSGADVHIMQLLPLRVDVEGRWERLPLPPAPDFASFAEYRAHLGETLARHVDNARDPARQWPLEPVVALSSGYDSPACAVLGAEVGVRRAVSITHARDRSDRSSVEDSGALIGEMLGLEVRTAPRDTSLSVVGEPVIDEFWATGMSGEEVVFRRLEPELRGALLITGNYGDTVWSRRLRPTTTLRRVDVGGSSLTEFRLRVGSAHLPLPVVGARAHPAIRAISDDPAMDQWSIGGSYDRPIPRRIVEEAGVARGSFGQAKRAVTMVGNRRSIGDPTVLEAILSHAERRGWDRGKAARHLVVELRRQLTGPLLRLLRLVTSRFGLRFDDTRRHGLHGPQGSLAFVWAAERLAERRYRGSPGRRSDPPL